MANGVIHGPRDRVARVETRAEFELRKERERVQSLCAAISQTFSDGEIPPRRWLDEVRAIIGDDREDRPGFDPIGDGLGPQQ